MNNSSDVYDRDWIAAHKPIMPNFIGSRAQLEGWDAELCPTCGKNLKQGICIHGLCHLREDLRGPALELVATARVEARTGYHLVAPPVVKRRKYGRRRARKVHVQLPQSGAMASVSSDIAPETLAALDEMISLAVEQFSKPE